MAMPENDALRFIEQFVALLDAGRYTATYKFATLAALVDVAAESVHADGRPPAVLQGRRVGERVLELLWLHSKAYAISGVRRPPAPAAPALQYLRHSTLKADLVTKITGFRERHGLAHDSWLEAQRRRPAEFAALQADVVTTVIRMPLPKLQRFSTGKATVEQRFLYDFGWPDEVSPALVRRPAFDDRLFLKAGVGELLVRLEGLLRPLIQQRWAAFVAERSADVVESGWLDEFLFGEDRLRLPLGAVRGPLLDSQGGDCFYCRQSARESAIDVDHFIPWARYPDNGLDNLVAAHRACNNAKRASLAASGHLRRWLDRFDPGAGAGRAFADLRSGLSWPSYPHRTQAVARSAYFWVPDGTPLWDRADNYEQADQQALRRLLRPVA